MKKEWRYRSVYLMALHDMNEDKEVLIPRWMRDIFQQKYIRLLNKQLGIPDNRKKYRNKFAKQDFI